MEIVIMAGQLLLALSILVGMHELGHMLLAKYFGMRVEKYSIGFPPKVFGFKKGETEYSIGALPLGGFVKISGMIDESLDTDQMQKEPQPWEFRAKPAWQRLLVMMGGIIVNLVLGIILFIVVFLAYGDKFYSKKEVNKYGIVAYDLGKKIGLKTGDKIINVNGADYKKFPQDILTPEVLLSKGSYYTVKRGDETLKVTLPENFISQLSSNKKQFLAPAFPFAVGKLLPGSNAEKAGIQTGDRIIAVNGSEVDYFQALQDALKKLKGEKVTLEIVRNGQQKELPVQVTEEGTVGFYPEILMTEEIQTYSLGEAIGRGTEKAFGVITNTVTALGKIFSGKLNASDSVAGPLMIAKEFGGIWIWQRFWILTASLSMILAFMNFLPIPALDGGHVLFLSYEIIAGRRPSDKFLENAQKVGMVLLLTLMVFVFGNDIYKLLFK